MFLNNHFSQGWCNHIGYLVNLCSDLPALVVVVSSHRDSQVPKMVQKLVVEVLTYSSKILFFQVAVPGLHLVFQILLEG